MKKAIVIAAIAGSALAASAFLVRHARKWA